MGWWRTSAPSTNLYDCQVALELRLAIAGWNAHFCVRTSVVYCLLCFWHTVRSIGFIGSAFFIEARRQRTGDKEGHYLPGLSWQNMFKEILFALRQEFIEILKTLTQSACSCVQLDVGSNHLVRTRYLVENSPCNEERVPVITLCEAGCKWTT